MADDKRSVIATQKPIVEESCNNVLSSASGSGIAKRNSNCGGGDTSGVNARTDNSKERKHQRQESREENSSTDTSLSVSGTSSPAKGNRSSNKERRPNSGFKSGRQGKGGGGGAKEQGTRKGALDAETEAPGPVVQGQEATSAPKNRGNKSKYSTRKRAPPKEDYEIKPNDVFVNEKSNFVAHLSKCKKLFEKGHKEIYLHGLGKAIPRAINVALELKKFYHETVDYTVNTSTVQLCDDVVDLENPDQPATVRTRNVSSIDIKVFRSLNIP